MDGPATQSKESGQSRITFDFDNAETTPERPVWQLADTEEEQVGLRHICLPAELSEDISPPSAKEHYTDNLLDPIRLSKSILREAYRELGAYGYAGQFQQTPSPPGGGMFKTDRFRYGIRPKNFRRMVRYWDKAACLYECTLIDTPYGQKPIASIRTGDLVLTRNGYQEVHWAGVSGFVDEVWGVLFSNGVVLWGTNDHPLYTGGDTWTAIDSLRDNHRALTSRRQLCEDRKRIRTRRLLCSTASGTADAQGGSISRPCATSTAHTVTRPCSKLSGDFFEAIYPTAIISITRTETTITTLCRTLNASRERSIVLSTQSNLPLERCSVGRRGSFGRIVLTNNMSVRTAAKLSSLGIPTCVQSDIVRINAAVRQGSVPVYNLEVRKEHEFFANGVLVHNTMGGGAYTVGCLMGVTMEIVYWVLDIIRVQVDSAIREKLILQTAKNDGKLVYVGIEQEPGSGGKESAEGTARRLSGYHTRIVRPTGSQGSKVIRADPFSTQVNMGNVYLIEGAPWIEEFISELTYFPVGKYADQVDAASGAFTILSKARLRVGPL